MTDVPGRNLLGPKMLAFIRAFPEGDVVGNDFGRIRFACFLVPQDDLSTPGMALVSRELIFQELDVFHEHVEVDTFLWRVNGQCANAETSNGSDVA